METRVKKRKRRSNKRLAVWISSMIGLLLVLCAAYLLMKNLHQQEPKTETAAAKPVAQTKTNHSDNPAKPNNSNISPKKSSTVSSADYLLPDSDKRVLSEEDIATLTKGQLRLARNEIYARHGYVFKSADLQNYFSSKPWYHTDTSYNGALNQIESENATLLKTRENHL